MILKIIDYCSIKIIILAHRIFWNGLMMIWFLWLGITFLYHMVLGSGKERSR